MMKKLVFGMFIVFAFACSNPLVEEKIDIKPIEKEVMEIHDEVMPRMSEVIFLTDAIDSVMKQEKDTIKLQEFGVIKESLVKSDKDMMHWMHSYKSPAQPYDSNSLNYINKEKEKVVKLRALILKSITDANTALKNKK
jgi:succinate dehydrogenase flavin-adding protein (antitoxin of CptAB toxin-antitoxin module)